MENKYWIVDSNNLSNVKDIFIGYTISEDGSFYLNEKPKVLDGTGCYTCIESFNDKIRISQDFLGMQGIYHFKNENRNIFSNGYEKIVDYIINLKYPLTLDKDYCIQYIFSNEQPINMNDTMLNEIKRIGKDYTIEININGKVNFIENDYGINSIKVDSKEAIEILDKWHNKWCNVIRNLVKLKSPLIFDLSGGMDSRICFGLLLNSNIDKKNVIIKRNIPNKTSYEKNFDDWDISQEIVDKYKYNERSNVKYSTEKKYGDINKYPIFEEFDNLMFGNSKICDYTICLSSNPIFHINGIYGDRMHLGGQNTISLYLTHKKKKFSKDMKKEDIKLLSDYIDKYSDIIIKKYETKNRPLFLGDFTSEYIQRFYGVKIANKIFQNDILISPFADPLCHKIQIHFEGAKRHYYADTLIYYRYFKELLDFKFETVSEKRIITEGEINFAKMQCKKYPYQKIKYDFIPDLTDKRRIEKEIIFKNDKIRNALKKRLEDGEEEFIKIFGKDYFELAIRDFKKENIKMQNYFTPIVSICSILSKLKNVDK